MKTSLLIGAFGGGAAPAFNPATLSFDIWQKASFAASPWVDNVSAGSSGTRNLTEATNPPAAGTAVNGKTPADFDGTNDRLANASALSTCISVAAGSFGALAFMDVAEPYIGPDLLYFQPPFLCDGGGNLAMYFSDAGFSFGCYTGSIFDDVTVACPISQWHFLQARWNNTTCEVRKDNGSWTTKAIVIAAGDITGSIKVGANYNNGFFINGKVLEQFTSKTRFTDTMFNDYYGYLKVTYPACSLP